MPETGQVVDGWANRHSVQWAFTRLGRRTENSFIESFNGPLRDE